MIDAEQIKRHVEKQNALRAAYARKFGGGDAESLLILEDLESLAYFYEPTFDEKRPDPFLSVFRDGQRATLLHIKTMTKARPLNEDEFIKELQKNEIE